MTIRVALNHRTTYRYDREVEIFPHLVRLRPAPHCRTPIHEYGLRIEPAEHFINWQQDPFGNYLARLVFLEKSNALTVDVSVVADLVAINPFDFFVDPEAERFPFEYDARVARQLAPYLTVSESGKRLSEWLAKFRNAGGKTVDFLVELNQRLQEDVGYTVRMEAGVQSCEETLRRGIGSCRDSAWLLVQILRHLGFGARFVSGYLVQLTQDEPSLDGPSGPESDFTDLHAWAEAYVPGAGWIGLDPTSGLMTGEGHIPLACTPHPQDAAPIEGSTSKAEVTFEFFNEVKRVHETARVTRPYSDELWQNIEKVADEIDQRLERNDVRLTMGGEPTFVSVDDYEADEWNTEALGEHKYERALDLANRLSQRFGAGGLTHFGQGKWYPGEELPRWAMTYYWRPDGEPLWREPSLQIVDDTDRGHGRSEADRFAESLARELGISADRLVPGFEDPLYYLWREGQLPDNVDLSNAKLDSEIERNRLRRILEGGSLGEVIGYALPLAAVPEQEGRVWRSSPWTFRRDRMFLLPGDSPMGYRLPSAALAQSTRAVEPFFERDPFAPALTLDAEPSPRSEILGQLPGGAREHEQSSGKKTGEHDKELVRTAMCIEPRNGQLHVFLPPTASALEAIALVRAIEATSENTGIGVKIEGYPLPNDPAIDLIQVTPDPGVIEVNVSPSANWSELGETTRIVYEEARHARLDTEKFMVDGRHTGTGGGNHVTIGGKTPADSPLLRRPDLLASMVTYWQHHPALSYLFSGLFIGPTSQSPRIDEARDEMLHELEIALAATPSGEIPEPWKVDRVFRNLLVDMTGNTHRAEFSMDKLYPPEAGGRRLGVLELRAFEMPPHERMSLAQALLVRGLVARFWDEPYRAQPIRWSTAVHDRFMLPHYLWRDLEDIVDGLKRRHLAFESAWFEPFLEFRFPVLGDITVQDMTLELRAAAEPWHVLGEEASGTGTSRYVDSSVERVQVKLSDFYPERFAVLCNGEQVPVRPTGVNGEYVAGVRFKAWDPPSGLHPSIPAMPELAFDIIDRWNQQSIGGCSYFVSHPGGRSHDTFPVNAREAEARRRARFSTSRQRAGRIVPPDPVINPHYPHTLDLRALHHANGI